MSRNIGQQCISTGSLVNRSRLTGLVIRQQLLIGIPVNLYADNNVQKGWYDMRKYDYSFLNNGLLPANLMNLISNISALKAMARV